MTTPDIVLLDGNPRPGKTTTAAMIHYLGAKLSAAGGVCQVVKLRDLIKQPADELELLGNLADGAILVLVFPIFVDTPPAQLLAWMARTADARTAAGATGGTLVAIVHSGYPEPIQRLHSRRVAQAFAKEAGLDWYGAMDFGGTPVIGGRELEAAGAFAKHMRAALDQLALDLVAKRPISATTLTAAARHKLPFPTFLAPFLMGFVVRKRWRAAGVKDPLARPYAAG